jgi:ABC-type multidrug transport system fused ATPase/permease subunit
LYVFNLVAARAENRCYHCLLLYFKTDEATSALDSENERQVQAALDNLQSIQRRTTLIIAHKLSTVRDADKIVLLSEGRVTEAGSHTEPMERSGTYAELTRRSSRRLIAPQR